MKPARKLRLSILALLLATAGTISACGQTGPLTLPTEAVTETDDDGDEDESENER